MGSVLKKSNTGPDQKRERLLGVLRGYGPCAVALSGGVDSAVVAAAAYRALGGGAVALTADSPSVARRDLADARAIAGQIGIRHLVIPTEEFDDPNYRRNDGSRCYFCKSELYDRIAAAIPSLGVRIVCSGANLDDAGDYRPGLTAAAERGVRHPLQEAGFRKADVRALAREWGLSNWDKPASPCLSSRVAPGVQVTPERTARIEAAEEFLRGELGLADCRLRLHEGELARLELPFDQLARLSDGPTRERVVGRMRELGFRYVTLDLEGLRSGSLNELVSLEVKRRFAPEAEPK